MDFDTDLPLRFGPAARRTEMGRRILDGGPFGSEPDADPTKEGPKEKYLEIGSRP